MSFIATEPGTRPAHAPRISNDGFFPDIELAHARLSLRLDGTVTDARLAHALTAAVLEVGNTLRPWKAKQRDQGYDSLDTVPEAERIGGVSRLVHAYLRAVYCLTRADLIERMADYDVSASGQKRVQALDDAPDEQRRNARWALADLLGTARTVVALI